MTKKKFVHLLQMILPTALFNQIRRRSALCQYNFHSAIRHRSDVQPNDDWGGIVNVCLHCGIFVERDRKGQWRAMPKFMRQYVANVGQLRPIDDGRSYADTIAKHEPSPQGIEPLPAVVGPELPAPSNGHSSLQPSPEGIRMSASRD